MTRTRRRRMTPDRFVDEVVQTIVDEGVRDYKRIFARPGTVTDEYWKRVLALYRSLGSGQRRVLLEMMRQVQVDTLSEIFGILDGSSGLGGRSEQFELFYTGGRGARVRLNGDLQGLVLEKTERD